MGTKTGMVELLASAARTTTNNSGGNDFPESFDQCIAYVTVTAASGTTPTLDIKYQVSDDRGTTWYDHSTLTQITAVANQAKLIENPGRTCRIVSTIAGTTPSFTYRVRLEGKRRG